MKPTVTITVLPGDGVGPEVTRAAVRVLEAAMEMCDCELILQEGLVGAAALRATGQSLPAETLRLCETSDAVLFGAVGDPDWVSTGDDRPENAILELRRHFELFANLRPVVCQPALVERTPFKAEIARQADFLFVRELTGGLYFGERAEATPTTPAFDTMIYEDHEIRRITEVALRLAEDRRGLVTSIDKANVLASMRQWRRVVEETATDNSRVRLEHHLVDSFATRILCDPGHFDVVLAPNLFGDILSDEAAALAGSLGLLPSASIGTGPFGLYEPVHGSAPDIAGIGVANPIGAILSVALMLRYTLGLEYGAGWIEKAVDDALAEGFATPDLATNPLDADSTGGLTDVILSHLEARFLDSSMPWMVV